MLKKFTCIICTLLLTVFLTPSSINANAQLNDSSPKWVEIDSEGVFDYYLNTATGEKVGAAYSYDFNGQLKKLSKEKLLEKLEEENKFTVQNNLSASTYATGISYELFGSGYVIQPKTRVTHYLPKGAVVTTVWTKTISESFTANIGLTAEMKSKIRGNAGFSWATSATSTSTLEYKFAPMAKDNGYIAFQPKVRETVGYLHVNGKKYSVTAQCPQKINGVLDGTFYQFYA